MPELKWFRNTKNPLKFSQIFLRNDSAHESEASRPEQMSSPLNK